MMAASNSKWLVVARCVGVIGGDPLDVATFSF
jgi:hypothetical protein